MMHLPIDSKDSRSQDDVNNQFFCIHSYVFRDLYRSEFPTLQNLDIPHQRNIA